MNLLVFTTLACLTGFAVGGIPSGLLLGKLKGIDVRRVGSGNIGAANVGRALGRPWGVAVFLLDATKGFVPTYAVGGALASPITVGGGSETVRALCWLAVGICAVLGHNYSPYLNFRGGKGVSTSLGVAMGVYPYLTLPALVALGTWVVCVAVWRMSSLGSISAAVIFPCVYLILAWRSDDPVTYRWPFLIFTLLVGLMGVVRHRANIARIVAGTEPCIGQARPPDSPRPDSMS